MDETEDLDTYSYGDSAGLTPDFPFNELPSGSSTKIDAKVSINS